MTILQDVSKTVGVMSEIEQLRADNAELRAKNEALKAAKGKLSFKVSEKGAVSVLGLQRFPVTLYRSQWERVIAAVPQLQAFITVNADSLASKD